MAKLFQSYDLSGLSLANRIVMAPMTRSRALKDAPDPSTALYYTQRASAGLIITEGTPISSEGRGYLYTPGIYNRAQIDGWKRVTEGVHKAGGKIFSQIWHVGRISHVSLQPGGLPPVAPTAITAETSNSFAYDENGAPGQVSCSDPRSLTIDEIGRVVNDFAQAAQNAVEAGFDGVEIHGANGYLLDQFINASVNTRTDKYGGSLESRLRFPLEVIDAVSDAIGARRVGLRISPFGRLHDMAAYPDEAQTWLTFLKELNSRKLAYLHLSDQHTIGGEGIPGDQLHVLRETYKGVLMAAGGFNKEMGEKALETGLLDLIAIGKPFIANPDLVERLENEWPLTVPSRNTFYGGGNKGYVDYPRYRS